MLGVKSHVVKSLNVVGFVAVMMLATSCENFASSTDAQLKELAYVRYFLVQLNHLKRRIRTTSR